MASKVELARNFSDALMVKVYRMKALESLSPGVRMGMSKGGLDGAKYLQVARHKREHGQCAVRLFRHLFASGSLGRLPINRWPVPRWDFRISTSHYQAMADAAPPQNGNGAAPTLIVHHLENSRSQRILWLLEELEVPYTIKEYKRQKGVPLAPDELKAIHPLGKAPAITDGDVTLAESGAIVEYIIKEYGNGKADPPPSGATDDLYFTHYAEGSFMPPMVNKLIFTLVPKHAPFFMRPIFWPAFAILKSQLVNPQIKQHVAFVEAHLEKCGDWFAGGDHPTAADYMMVFPLEGLQAWDPALLGPKMKAYIERAQARPAYKRASEKGGKLELGKL